MWEKVKNFLAVVGGVALAVLSFGLFRRGADGRGIQEYGELIELCKDDASRAAGHNSGIAEELAVSTGLAEGIAGDNRDAVGEIDAALGILGAAKKRSEKR